jgi:hypothetical protein
VAEGAQDVKFYPHDWLLQELLKNIDGHTAVLQLPPDLSVDERASLANACVVPEVAYEFTNNGEQLILWRVLDV